MLEETHSRFGLHRRNLIGYRALSTHIEMVLFHVAIWEEGMMRVAVKNDGGRIMRAKDGK
jgi:hypothetical protein